MQLLFQRHPKCVRPRVGGYAWGTITVIVVQGLGVKRN